MNTLMSHKRHKSNATSELLQKETKFHFVNALTNKIDLKMFVKHLHEKDEFENCEIEIDVFDDSDFYDNQLMTADFNSYGEESDKFVLTQKKVKRKRQIKAGSTCVYNFLGRRTKSKKRCSSWVLLHVNDPHTKSTI